MNQPVTEIGSPIVYQKNKCSCCGVETTIDPQKSSWSVNTSLVFQIGTIAGYVSKQITLCSKCFGDTISKAKSFIEGLINYE